MRGSGEGTLGQGWALVWRMHLVTDQDDVAVIAFGPEGSCRGRASEPRSHALASVLTLEEGGIEQQRCGSMDVLALSRR